MLKDPLVVWCIILSSVVEWGEVGLPVCLSGGQSLVLRRFHIVSVEGGSGLQKEFFKRIGVSGEVAEVRGKDVP